MKKFVLVLFLFVIYLLSATPTNSAILFNDNFESNTGNWTTKFGGPNFWTISNGKLKFIINSPSIHVAVTSIPIPQRDYVIEFDYTPKTGEDKNIGFRWNENLFYPYYDIHFISIGGGQGILSRHNNYENWPKIVNYNLSNNTTYHFKIVLNNQNIKVYINDSLVYDVIDVQYTYIPNDKVGLWATTGADFPTEVWFDNIVVRTLDEESDLNVPLLKQTDNPWQSNTYDSANLWSPLSPTINRWGCALTSATMILKYYGINKLPDSTTLDPGTVNTWLKSQSDGYIGNGMINWLALSRLSRLAKNSGFNPGFVYDALEYRRFPGYNPTQLTVDLQNSQPDILEQPGHFIVAKGVSGNSFSINDPFFSRLTLDDGYNNTFSSIGHYTPSNTDLSYIMLVSDQDVDVSLSDEGASTVGEQFVQQPISNPLDPVQSSGKPLKITYLRKPSNGNYNVVISNSENETYELTSYLYDVNGEVSLSTHSGVISSSSSDILQIDFNSLQSSQSSTTEEVTFQSIANDIDELFLMGEIRKDNIARRLKQLLSQAQANLADGRISQSEKRLARAFELLEKERGTSITEEAYKILFQNLSHLENSL